MRGIVSGPKVKICGITREADRDGALDAGANFLGYVFYPPSPRYIAPEAAFSLMHDDDRAVNVGLFVMPELTVLGDICAQLPLKMLQLHGAETPERVQKIRQLTGLPVMKALRIGAKLDLAPLDDYASVCDWLLFDAYSAEAPGGTGHSFDWSLLADMDIKCPWMLAGGLTAGNIGAALSVLHPDAVDVSSGVEDAPGQKNPEKIKEFIAAAQQKH